MGSVKFNMLRLAIGVGFVFACASEGLAQLESLLFLEGEVENPMYVVAPSETPPINTDAVTFISGNVNDSATAPVPGGSGRGTVRLVRSCIAAPFPGTVGWVNELATGTQPKNAYEQHYTSGSQFVGVLKNIFDSYYRTSDTTGLDPERVYLNFDFDPNNGDYIGLKKIIDEAAAQAAERHFYIAWRVRQTDVPARNGLLDVSYYRSTALMMYGNVELEKAYSVRFLMGIQLPGLQVIDDEMLYLGWDSNATTPSFSEDHGAHRYFDHAGRVWLALFNSPLRRSILLDREPYRTLVQSAKAFTDARRPTTLPAGDPWPPQVYDGYMDAAAMIRALAQRAKVTDEVARRLVLLLRRAEAANLINQTARDVALLEGVISSVLFPGGIVAQLGDDHASKYPGLAESFLTFRATMESMLRTRDAALNPRFNALGFDKDVMLILPGENAENQLFTFDWLRDHLVGPTNNPLGALYTATSADIDAELTKRNYMRKSADYLQQFDQIENEYDRQLIDLCGPDPLDFNKPNLDRPDAGSGLIRQQMRNVDVARNGIQRVIRQMQNVQARVEIERDRVAKVHGILNRKAEMVINDGNRIASLTQEIGELDGWMKFADNMTQAVASATDAISENPFDWAKGGVKAAAYTANAVTQLELQKKVAEKQGQTERIRALQEANAIRFEAAIVDADSEAQIRTWLLDLETLKIDLLDAEITLAQEMDRLEQYLAQMESLVVRRDRALHRLTRRSFADPTFRIEVLNSALLAEEEFKKAQIWVYLTAKALEYKWAEEFAAVGSPYADVLPRILRARKSEDLLDSINNQRTTDDALTLSYGSRLFYWNYSLRKDFLGMTFDKTIPGNPPRTLSGVEQFQDHLADIASRPENLVDLSGDGVPDHFAVRFSTVRFDIPDDVPGQISTVDSLGRPQQADGQPIFDPRLWDDKIDWLQVNMIGNNVYTPNPQQMPIELWYGGSGFVRARQPFQIGGNTIEYRVVPVPHVTFESTNRGFKWDMKTFLKEAMTAKLVTNPREIPDFIFQTHNFREHPVAATDWRLLLPLSGTNIYNIRDIEVVIVHRARTRQ